MNKEINNSAVLNGTVTSKPVFSHEVYGESFFTFMVENKRRSETKDTIPVLVSERLANVGEDWSGKQIKACGQFRSYNQYTDGKTHIILSLFANDFCQIEKEPNENHILLNGFICKPPVYRKTPLGREITDILLAVNRSYGKSDYIPCVCWGRNARFSSSLEVGNRILLEGRIQSREYQKRISETESETRTAYEVSVSKLTVVNETEG